MTHQENNLVYEKQLMKAKLLAFDVGGTAIKVGIWVEGKLHLQPSITTPENLSSFMKEIETIKMAAESKYGKLEGMTFSLPGAVDSSRGKIGGVSAVPYIHGFPFVDYLENAFDCPICIENDANCAALAELKAGGARAVQNAVVIVIGSGIGGAVIIEKKIVKGKHLFGGEFGYMQLNNEHTFSQAASPVHHARRYSLEKSLTAKLSGEELFERALSGDDSAKISVEYLKDSLARGIFNVMMVIDPDCVLIGGAISTRPGFVVDIEKRVNDYLVKNRAHDIQTPIGSCHFSKEANLMGAIFNYASAKI